MTKSQLRVQVILKHMLTDSVRVIFILVVVVVVVVVFVVVVVVFVFFLLTIAWKTQSTKREIFSLTFNCLCTQLKPFI